ncbi:MAG: hypothetical protein AAFX56_06025 [Pseudomonadota bacterium]
MKNLTIASTLALSAIVVIGGIASALTGAPGSERADWQPPKGDDVAASFERELNRQPVPAAPARRDALDEDVLYKMMNEVHWTEDARTPDDKARKSIDAVEVRKQKP